MNADKTKYIIFHSPHKDINPIMRAILVNDQHIERIVLCMLPY